MWAKEREKSTGTTKDTKGSKGTKKDGLEGRCEAPGVHFSPSFVKEESSMLLRVVPLLTSVALLIPAIASAQEKTFGITAGFPASVGLFFKLSDRVAVRPEFTFSKSKGDDQPTVWSVGTGVTGLFYLNTMSPLRTYVAPRFTYARQNSTDEGFFTFETAADVYSLSALFGAQYLLGDRFIVYGEVGARGSYTSSRETITSPFNSFSSEPTGYTVGTTGGVGIVLLF
jgi:hypothetical protein